MINTCLLQHGQDDDDTVRSSDEYAPENSLPDDQSGRWARVTFKIIVSYHGEYFDGWQKQPGLNTVQGYVSCYFVTRMMISAN